MTSAERDRLMGIVLLVVSAVCLITVIIIAWNGVARWRAVHAANAWQMARLAGNTNYANDAAQRAAALGRNDAALALPSIDITQTDTARLNRLRREVPARQRRLVDTTLAFHAILHGGADGNLDGVDGRLLNHVVALKRGGVPPLPRLNQGDVATAAILDRAVQTHVQAAWNAGNAEELRAGLEAFTLLRPDHAEHAKARTVLAALTGPDAASFVHDIGSNRTALLRQLALLAPDHANSLVRLIPEAQQTPDEIQHLLLAGGDSADLKQQVERALANPGEAVFVVLFRRSLSEDQTDLTQRLVERAPASIKPDMELALAFHRGDVTTVARLQPDRRDLQPRITAPFGRDNLITFHLMTEAGLVPRGAGLDIRLNEERVALDRIKRRGSLVEVQFRGVGVTVNLEVKLSEQVVFAGPVRL